MRSLLTTTASIGILVGAYLYAFGQPSFVGGGDDTAAQVVLSQAPADDGSQTEAPRTEGPGASGRRARPEGGRPGGRGGANATTVVLTPLEELPYDDVFSAVGSARALRSVDVVTHYRRSD